MGVRESEVPSVQELLEKGPEGLGAWLDQVAADGQHLPARFNWEGLAYSAGLNALKPTPQDLAWARIALRVYDRLASEESDESARFSSQLSAMLVRARMIGLMGPVTGDPVLDPRPLFEWFFGNLPMSREEASRKATSWRASSPEEIRALRRIKDRLGVIKRLSEKRPDLATEETSAWLALYDKLP